MRLVNELDCHWRRSSQVLDILTTAARAAVDIEDLFSFVDRDGDGRLTREEFGDTAEGLVGHRMTEAEVDMLFSAFDADGDGKVVSLSQITQTFELVDTWDVSSVEQVG